MVVCLWCAYESLRVAIADLLYPQQQVLRRSHWVHRAEKAEKKRRLQQALHWTSNNGWYWHSLARLEAEAARHTLRASPVTMDLQRQAKAKLHQAASTPCYPSVADSSITKRSQYTEGQLLCPGGADLSFIPYEEYE